MENISAGSGAGGKSAETSKSTSSSTSTSAEAASFNRQVDAASNEKNAAETKPNESKDQSSNTPEPASNGANAVASTASDKSSSEAKADNTPANNDTKPESTDNSETKEATKSESTNLGNSDNDGNSSSDEFHTVKSGDTFDAIAKANDLSRAEMMDLNPQFSNAAGPDGLTKAEYRTEMEKARNGQSDRVIDAILPGEPIRIGINAPNKQHEIHTVKSGDAFDRIAIGNNLTRQELMSLNPQFSSVADADGLSISEFEAEYKKASTGQNNRIIDAIFPGEELRVAVSHPEFNGNKSAVTEANIHSGTLVKPDTPVSDDGEVLDQNDAPTLEHEPTPQPSINTTADSTQVEMPQPAAHGVTADQIAGDRSMMDAVIIDPTTTSSLPTEIPLGPVKNVEPKRTGESLITSPGLVGDVDDVQLTKADATRIQSIRFLADQSGNQNGEVSVDESQRYLQTQENIHQYGPDTVNGVLDTTEQEAIIRLAAADKTTNRSATHQALLDRTVDGFGTISGPLEPSSIKDDVTGISHKAAVGLFEPMVSLFQAGDVNTFNFNSNLATTRWTLAITPNADISSKKLPGRNIIRNFELPNGLGKMGITAAAWGGLTSSVNLSQPLATEGGVQRTATVYTSAGIWPEATIDVNVGPLLVRPTATGTYGPFSSYSITTKEDRLQKIFEGKEGAPNPYTFENFKPGDTVNLTTGFNSEGYAMVRFLDDRSWVRQGIEIKRDWYNVENANQLVVSMLPTENGEAQHVIVARGKNTEDLDHTTAGLMVNPNVEKIKEYAYGAFFRAQLGHESYASNAQQDFVTIDIKSPDGLRLYNEILATGTIPTGQVGQRIEGALVHGSSDTESLTKSTRISLAGYLGAAQPSNTNLPADALADHTPSKLPRALQGLQGMAGYNLYLNKDNESTTERQIRYVDPSLNDPSIEDRKVGTNGTDGTSVSGNVQTHQSLSAHGSTTAILVHEVELGTQTMLQKTGIFDPNTKEIDVVNAFQNEIEQDVAGKPPIVESIILETPSGNLQGQAAVDYLETHTNPKNQGRFIKWQDRVDHVGVGFQNTEARDHFLDMVTKGAEAQGEAFLDQSVITLNSAVKDHAIQSMVDRVFFTSESPSNFYNSLALSADTTPEQKLKHITRMEIGAFINHLEKLRQYTQSDETFPITVRIKVDY